MMREGKEREREKVRESADGTKLRLCLPCRWKGHKHLSITCHYLESGIKAKTLLQAPYYGAETPSQRLPPCQTPVPRAISHPCQP